MKPSLKGNKKRSAKTITQLPKKETLEYLFKDYSGKSFRTELVNPQKPMGNEKW
jgi:hypothetical protein